MSNNIVNGLKILGKLVFGLLKKSSHKQEDPLQTACIGQVSLPSGDGACRSDDPKTDRTGIA